MQLNFSGPLDETAKIRWRVLQQVSRDNDLSVLKSRKQPAKAQITALTTNWYVSMWMKYFCVGRKSNYINQLTIQKKHLYFFSSALHLQCVTLEKMFWFIKAFFSYLQVNTDKIYVPPKTKIVHHVRPDFPVAWDYHLA